MKWTYEPCEHPRFESDRGHTWFVEKQWDSPRAALILVGAPNHRGARKELVAMECASIAEAEIMAACVEYADDVDCADAAHMLHEAGFMDGGRFPRNLTNEVLSPVLQAGPDPHLYVHGRRRWFGTEEGQLQVAIDPDNHFPLYCFSMGRDRVVKPDLVQFYPSLLRCAKGPISTTVLFGYLEILKARLDLNGSRHAPLEEGQQDELINRFDAADFSSDANSYRF